MVQVGDSSGGGSVSAVCDCMDHDVADAGGLCEVTQRDEVLDVAVYAAIGDKTKEVEAAFCCLVKGILQNFVFRQLIIANCLINTGEILVNDAARAQVEMADLRVSHLAFRQAHVFTAGGQGGMRVSFVKVVMKGGLGQEGSVPVRHSLGSSSWIDSPTVTDNKHNWFFHSGN